MVHTTTGVISSWVSTVGIGLPGSLVGGSSPQTHLEKCLSLTKSGNQTKLRARMTSLFGRIFGPYNILKNTSDVSQMWRTETHSNMSKDTNCRCVVSTEVDGHVIIKVVDDNGNKELVSMSLPLTTAVHLRAQLDAAVKMAQVLQDKKP